MAKKIKPNAERVVVDERARTIAGVLSELKSRMADSNDGPISQKELGEIFGFAQNQTYEFVNGLKAPNVERIAAIINSVEAVASKI